jgi:methylated-DNA-[protein]-cysteine S-methyltransferase
LFSNKISSVTFKTILGKFLICSSSKGIKSLKLLDNNSTLNLNKNSRIIDQTIKQLDEYFNGQRIAFTIPIDLHLPFFYQKVLLNVKKILFGSVISYKQIAINCNNSKACRAVGTANNLNPIPILIPCHRVVPSDGSIGNYAYGKKIKRFLLEHEGHSINDNLFFS